MPVQYIWSQKCHTGRLRGFSQRSRTTSARNRVQKLIKKSLKRIGVVWLGLRVGSAVCVSDRGFYHAFLESERSVEQCLKKFERLDYERQRFEEVEVCGK